MTILRLVLQKVWEGRPLTGDDLIALILLFAMVASICHLITMLITRWGDRYIALKSLLASVLVHAVCFLGLEVFEPLTPGVAAAERQTVEREQPRMEILISSEDSIPFPESGNTPLADQTPEPDVPLERMAEPARQMNPDPEPIDEPENLDSLKPDVRDVSQQMQSSEPSVAPEVDSGTEGPRTAAVVDPDSNAGRIVERSSTDILTPRIERRIPEKGALSAEPESLLRDMSSGSVPRIGTDVVIKDTSIPITAGNNPDAVLIPDGATTDAEDVQRKSAPLTGTDPLRTAGIELDPAPARRARSFDSRIPRPDQMTRSTVEGERPIQDDNLTPQTPLRLTNNYDVQRIGEPEFDISDSLMTAAELLESSPDSLRRRDTRPAAYKLRDTETRQNIVKRFGGTSQSEAAVELSLKWLSSVQSRDGSWNAEAYGAGRVEFDENNVNRDFAGRNSDTGVTALIILSFLGAGYTHEGGPYAVQVDQALDWLIRQQDSNGSLAGNARHYARMYCHAMATYALAEAVGMQQSLLVGPIVNPQLFTDGTHATEALQASLLAQQGLAIPGLAGLGIITHASLAEETAYSIRKVDEIALKGAMLRAVTFTLSQQNPKSGGWRYEPGQEGDISMFGWHLMSLKSASIAGVRIKPIVSRRMIDFLHSVSEGEHGGLFGYRRSGKTQEPISEVMTAEALFCRQMLGYPRDAEHTQEAVSHILDHMPKLAELNHYYWYYGTLAMYQHGGPEWEKWNVVVRDTLTSEQRRDGRFAGSWDPKGPWGRYGGRLYSTALSTLTLEVYYRLLPLYRMNDASTANTGAE